MSKDFGNGFLVAAVMGALINWWVIGNVNDGWAATAEDITDNWHASYVRQTDRCVDAIEIARGDR